MVGKFRRAADRALQVPPTLKAQGMGTGRHTSTTTVHSRSRRWLAPVVFGALLCAALLAGCAPATKSDPIAAASVDNRPISLASYTQVVAVYRILAARQQSASDWQSPAGRKGLADVQKQALTFLENLEIYRAQLAKYGLKADPKVLASDEQMLQQNIQSQLKQTPNDSSLIALNNALTPDVLELFAEQDADMRALVASPKVQVPVVHARILLAKSENDAKDMKAQLEKNSASFADLAKTHDDQTVPPGGDFGTVYMGQFTGLPSFDSKALLSQSTSTPATRYLILNDANEWELFELTQPGTKPISSLTDQQQQQTVFSAWVDEVVKPHTTIQQFVTL
jgi:hypothetical protein